MPMARSSLWRRTLTIRKYHDLSVIRCSRVLLYESANPNHPYCFHLYSLIVAFNVEELKEGEEFKVNWKEVETAVRKEYPTLKLTYARGDDHGGQLAISNLRLKEDLLQKLLDTAMTIQEKSFKFSKLEGEPLKEFWQNQGGHYNFCIQHKLRQAKKAAK